MANNFFKIWPRNLISSYFNIIGLSAKALKYHYHNKPYHWKRYTEGETHQVVMCGKHIVQGTYLKTSFTKNAVTDLTGSSLSPGATVLDLSAGQVSSTFMHKPAAATFPGSQQFPNCLLLCGIPGCPILFSGVKQIQNKLVGRFSHFTSSQKTEVPKVQYKMDITTFFWFTESVNFRAGKNHKSNHSSLGIKIFSFCFSGS